MVAASALVRRLRDETEAMVAATSRLASIDSGSGDADGLARVHDAFAALLTDRGFAVAPGPEGGLTATTGASLDGVRTLVVGHADTVWPAGTAARWPVRREGPMLSGPGVGDMKGCLVMAAHAIAALRDARGADRLAPIELVVVDDEELGSVSSRPWIEARARAAAACLGLEAGWPGGGVVCERGAVGALTVAATGRSAHAAGHEDRGASAVAALAPLVAALEELTRPERGVLVSVGIFRGGSARQVVPDHAELAVDLRAPDTASAEAAVTEIRRLIDGAGAGSEVTVALGGGVTRPAMPIEASRRLWELAGDHAAELGITLECKRSRGGSDASFAAALGVPTLDGLGPICHDSCARGERIEIDSLATRGALMALLLDDLCDGRLAGAHGVQARDSGNVDAPA
jgi:glutamate carboxypeptidase